MSIKVAYYVPMWKEVLTLCRLKPSEHVVILTTENSRPDNLAAAQQAVLDIGASYFRMDLPPVPPSGIAGLPMKGKTPLAGNLAAVEVLKRADFVIDLIGLLHSKEQIEILGSGTRMLMVMEAPEILAQMIPTPEDKRRVMAGDRMLKAARVMQVASAAGTDLTLKLGAYATLPEYGYADEPGHWDHWPSGFISTWPTEGTAQGRVVLDVGDMLFPMKTYVQSPVTLTIDAGFIRRIEGGFDARYLQKHIESYNDPLAFAVSHVGWGLQPRAKWASLGMRDKSASMGMDSRAFEGNFLFSTGPNIEGGGTNASACHVDIPMSGCTVRLDGRTVVDAGEVVDDELKLSA